MHHVVADISPWPYHTTRLEEIILWVAISFFGAGMLSIVVIFTSRTLKSIYQMREDLLKSEFAAILNSIVVNESISDSNMPGSALQYRIEEIRRLAGSSRFAKNVLIKQLVRIKKNLTGRAAETLTQTYLHLGLQSTSLKKLNSLQWNVKVEGIRELAEMGYREAQPRIFRYLKSSNQILREESFLALVRLDEENPLGFLDNYEPLLTSWMRIHIYHFLLKIDPRKLPDFSQWFQHPNQSVAIFSLSMARKFRQHGVVQKLMPLLHHESDPVVAFAIETLGELEAYEKADDVAEVLNKYFDNADISFSIARTLGLIGDHAQVAGIMRLVDHPDHKVRFEATRSLKKLDTAAYQSLRENTKDPLVVDRIIKHLEEPLLQ